MAPNLHLAAYQTDLAHNLGSMIRLSACFGVTLDIIGPCGFPLSEKSLKEAALDYGEKCEMILHSDWLNFKKSSINRRLILLSTKAKKICGNLISIITIHLSWVVKHKAFLMRFMINAMPLSQYQCLEVVEA